MFLSYNSISFSYLQICEDEAKEKDNTYSCFDASILRNYILSSDSAIESVLQISVPFAITEYRRVPHSVAIPISCYTGYLPSVVMLVTARAR